MLACFDSLDLESNSSSTMENPPLSACDACYTRKIKCDRGDPCANCQDSRARCLRKRAKQVRKPRDAELEYAIREIKASVSDVQSSVGHLLSTKPNRSSTPSPSNGQSSLTPTSDSGTGRRSIEATDRKRTSAIAFETENPGLRVERSQPFKRAASPRTPIEKPYSPAPFSTSEAQALILRELANGSNLSAEKRAAFQTALSSLNQSVRKSQQEIDEPSPWSLPEGKDLLENPSVPPASVVQWMVQAKGRHSFCVPDTLPLLSRQTIFRMSRRLLDSDDAREDIASLICIDSCVAYFLWDHIMTWGNELEPGDPLRHEVETYFHTARAAISHLNLMGPPTLENLQALQFGAINAQEVGDIDSAWRFTSAACTIIYALDLHKMSNAFTDDRKDEAFEAYACFGFTYMQDKGLAMNLGRPACLQDLYIEDGVIERPIHERPRPTLFYDYLNLARVQSRIITDLHSAARSSMSSINGTVTAILGRMDGLWQSLQEFRKTRLKLGNEADAELEFAMYDFAFYSIKTVLLHSGSEKSRNPKLAEACINAARASFAEIQHMRGMASEEREGGDSLSIDGLMSLGNWSIVYYPFTPFFVLFCNAISTGNQSDLLSMKQFVDYLAELKEYGNPPVAKLHKLCMPFLNLAICVLETSDASNNAPNEITSAPRPKLEFPESSIPGTSTFQAIPPSVPQLSIHQAPMIDHSMLLNSDMPPGFPTFTSAPPDDMFWQLMDAQPRLQWLDSDFSGLEPAWSDASFENSDFM